MADPTTDNPWMQFLIPALATGTGVLSNLPQTGTSKTNSSGTGTTAASGSVTGSSTSSGFSSPNLDPATMDFRNQLIQKYLASLSSDPNLSGYAATQTKNINQNADIQQQLLQNNLASRGLSYSPVAALAPAAGDQNRLNQISSFQGTLPLLAQQLADTHLSNAANFFHSIPYGTTTGSSQDTNQQSATNQVQNQTSNSDTTTKTGSAAGAVAGGLAGLGGALAKIFLGG